mmetsp:Transcript_23386/g.25970  ORF Transcript_23386/g.25970 Transcript_23386/m.25970 type:complete len:342 (-) Transcript_23386:129-1154(-)
MAAQPYNPTQSHGGGNTNLHVAIVADNNEDLTPHTIRSVGVNTANFDGEIPLHIAVAAGKVDIIRLLVQNGANPNVVLCGRTPEQIARDHHASSNPHLFMQIREALRAPSRVVYEQEQQDMDLSDMELTIPNGNPTEVINTEQSPVCQFFFVKMVSQVRKQISMEWYPRAVEKGTRNPLRFSVGNRSMTNCHCIVSRTPKGKKYNFSECCVDCSESNGVVNGKYSMKGLKINQWYNEEDNKIYYNIILAFAYTGVYDVKFKYNNVNICCAKINVTSYRPSQGCTVDRHDHITECTSEADMETKLTENRKKHTNIKRELSANSQNKFQNNPKKRRKCPEKNN